MNALLGWVTVKPVLCAGVLTVITVGAIAACYLPGWTVMGAGIVVLTIALMAAGLFL